MLVHQEEVATDEDEELVFGPDPLCASLYCSMPLTVLAGENHGGYSARGGERVRLGRIPNYTCLLFKYLAHSVPKKWNIF